MLSKVPLSRDNPQALGNEPEYCIGHCLCCFGIGMKVMTSGQRLDRHVAVRLVILLRLFSFVILAGIDGPSILSHQAVDASTILLYILPVCIDLIPRVEK